MDVCVVCCIVKGKDKETSKEKVQREKKRRNSGRKLLVGAKFSTPVGIDPGAHTASYTMGTGAFSRG
jgi:hypothetical protein